MSDTGNNRVQWLIQALRADDVVFWQRHEVADLLDGLIAARKEAADLRAKVDAFESATRDQKAYCIHCGWEGPWITEDDGGNAEVNEQNREHERTCAKHPMRALEAERDRLKAAAAQPAASEAEIAARFDGIKARQIAIATLARNGESDESVREEYASQYEAFEELLALMRRGARGDGALLRELTEARSVIELAASQLRVAWEKRDDAPLSAQSHLQEAAFALFHHAPKDGVLSTETVKLRQSVWKEIREAHQPEPKSDAGLREAAQALKVAFDADNYSEDHLTAVFKALAAHPPAPAAPVVPAVEDDEALLRQWLKEHVPTSSTDRVIAELCRRALKEKP